MKKLESLGLLGRWGVWAVLSLLALLLWDASTLDLATSRWFASGQGFLWRDHWVLSELLHKGARTASRIFLLIFILTMVWPVGAQRLLTMRERVSWVLCTLLVLLVVPLIKHFSLTSCPWDLAEFGGAARWVSHWSWGVTDGGPGGCFPAGHASTGFAFLTGYFWLHAKAPKAARWWLVVVICVGLVLGVAQQIRGAHYMSHTLWTAWLCWVAAGGLYAVFCSAFRRSD